MSSLYCPARPPPIASSTPRPQGKKKTNEGGGLGAKWTVEDDRLLVESWINVSTNPVIGADHKKSGFWNKVTLTYNRYPPDRAVKRTGKMFNARWNRASSLVSKWCGYVEEAYQTNASGLNEDTIMQLAHQLYKQKVGKRFDVMH